MPATFDSLVTEIRGRSAEEKAELKFLLERELIEERRREILANDNAGRSEEENGALQFFSKASELRKSLV
jgi:hypothetical protein